MPITINIRVYDTIDESTNIKLQERVKSILDDADCEVQVDLNLRPFNFAEAQKHITQDVTSYIKARHECGQIALIAFKEINRQDIYNKAINEFFDQCLKKFPDVPLGFFVIPVKGSIRQLGDRAELLKAQYQQIKEDFAEIVREVESIDLSEDPASTDDTVSTADFASTDDTVSTADFAGTDDTVNGAAIAGPSTVLISFMGKASDYEETNYQDQENLVTLNTNFSAHYAYKKYQPRKAIILCTNGVLGFFNTNLNYEVTRSTLTTPEFDEIFVAKSYTDPELNHMDIWHLVAVFDKILEDYKISSKEKIILDVTHGYRIIPMFIISLFRYLTVIKGFQPENVVIIYANYRVGVANCTVYELDVFQRMDDWTDAAKGVVYHGNARAIVKLLHSYQSKIVDMATKTSIVQLENVLTKWVETVQLANWEQYYDKFSELNNQIVIVLAVSDLAPEIKYVLQWIQQQFAEIFALTSKASTPENELKIQELMLGWYINCEMYTQAALLTREYLISKYLINHGTYRYNGTCWDHYHPCNWKQNVVRNGKKDYMPIFLNSIYIRKTADSTTLVETRNSFGKKVEDVRNAIAHGSAHPSSQSIIDIVNHAKKYPIADIPNTEARQILDYLQSQVRRGQ